MDKNKAEKKIVELKKKIRYHDYLYYVLDNPEISDAKYDEFMLELKNLEELYPDLITSDSPTQRVGSTPLEEFGTIVHTKPMLSLDTALDKKEIIKFDERIKKELNLKEVDYIAEPKLDGLSVEVIYENGNFVKGSTRGDGFNGEDVTENIKTIKAVPLILRNNELKPPKMIAVRGEVIMNISDFEKFNKKLIQKNEQPLANPRNAAAGSLRRLNPNETALRPLDIFFYEIMTISDIKIENQWNALQCLKKWGLKTNINAKICNSIDEVITYQIKMFEKRDELDYEIDGVVIKLNNIVYQNKLGVKAKSPRWAIAFKFPSRKEITQVLDITSQVGRTGTLTPVALLKPVDVGGVTVSRATLHNQGFIDKIDVQIGDFVKIGRAGDVIPEVAEVIKSKRTGKEKKYHIPEKCPICDSKVVIDGAFYRCTGGLTCIAQLKRSIAHFASKGAMDIEHLGIKNVELLVDQGLLKSVSNIYKLKKEDLIALPRFADKSAENLINAIENSKDKNLARFIYALGIQNIGEHIAKILASRFKSLEKLINANDQELLSIFEIGPETVNSIISFFKEERNLKEIENMKKLGVKAVILEEKIEKAGPLSGKKFIFTGTLKSFSRDNAKKILEGLDGRTTSTISANIDYVVVGNDPGSKYEKAKKLGLKIINEEEFKKMISK